MVSDTLEQRIYELVRSHDGIYLFKKKELTPSTDLDSDLQLEDDEVLALMDDFFTTFNVDKGNFSITTYYPPEPPLKHLLNPFRKNDIPQVPDFTIGMLIASARAGCAATTMVVHAKWSELAITFQQPSAMAWRNAEHLSSLTGM